MRTHLLAAVATAALLVAGGATAAFADDPAPAADAKPAKPAKAKKGKAKGSGSAAAPAPAAAPADAKPTKPAKGKKGKKGKGSAEAAPAAATLTPPPPPTTVTIKAPPAPAPAPVAPPPPAEVPSGPVDDDAPTIAHTPLTRAPKGKPLVFTARMQDPSGIFQPVLYLRKRGTGDFIPIKMIGSKVTQGDYAVEVDAKLVSVDLEYYIECYDNAGNGPSRAGSPDNPLVIKLELPPPPPVVIKGEKVVVEEKKPAGAPPAISHSTVSKAIKGQAVEIAAKLVGDTGVSAAKVFFRHVGEKEFKELPMGNIGGDDYTASMPPIVVTGDLEYYLEAYDRYGNGPGRSGGPHVPYTITVTEKAPEPPPAVVIKTAPGNEEKPVTVTPPPPPPPVRPRLVKAPFKPNPGRWFAWIAMGGFVGSLAFAGGEAYSAWSTDQVYQHTFNVDGRLLPDLHQKSLDDSKRAKIFGIAAAGSLVVGITLLLIFPEFPETQLVTGSGGDLTLVRF